ncbi:MAG TPA: acyl-CoA synthetase, partial [Acidimicrobiaceae bacterium]|nr:acyl-CoA synthetase [Acidimicrobiaceae bacterium]
MELLEGLVRRAGNTGDGEMVVVGDDRMSAEALLSLADATAARIRGARAIALCATPSM